MYAAPRSILYRHLKKDRPEDGKTLAVLRNALRTSQFQNSVYAYFHEKAHFVKADVAAPSGFQGAHSCMPGGYF